MCESKPTMKVLCKVAFKDKTITELDIRGKNLGTEGALVVSYYLENNGALTSLNISSNKLTQGKWTNALGDSDRGDDKNYETDMSGL